LDKKKENKKNSKDHTERRKYLIKAIEEAEDEIIYYFEKLRKILQKMKNLALKRVHNFETIISKTFKKIEKIFDKIIQIVKEVLKMEEILQQNCSNIGYGSYFPQNHPYFEQKLSNKRPDKRSTMEISVEDDFDWEDNRIDKNIDGNLLGEA
jgi:hypothetical protein